MVSKPKASSLTKDVVSIDTKVKRFKKSRKAVVKVSKKRPPEEVNKKSLEEDRFSQDIEEISQETENLVSEIEKWQT